MKKRPTIIDVARESGLSSSTVSLVINRSGYVRDATRKRVQDVIDRLEYHPSHSARRLASRTSGNIGFILTEDHFSQAEPFYTRIFLGTEFEARKHNYYILLTTIEPHFKKNGNTPRFLLERNVDGVIIAGKISDKLVKYIQEIGIPVVLVDYELKHQHFSSVLIDNRRGATAAVRHLIECGHKDIAFVGGDIEHPSIAERFEGFKEAIAEAGLTLNNNLINVEEEDTGVVNGYNAMQRILERQKPTAVFAANDAMAIGCMQLLKQSGVRIPEDAAIVGFDDIEMSSHTEPRLTTVRVFKEDMGKIAVQRMVEIIKSKTQVVATSYVHVELVRRESTGCDATAEMQPFSHED